MPCSSDCTTKEAEMATEATSETNTATKLKLDPPEALQPDRACRRGGACPAEDGRDNRTRQACRPIRRRARRTGRKQPRIRQEGRSAHRDGPKGNRRSGGSLEPFPRPAGQGDRQGHRHRRGPHRASPNRRITRPEGERRRRAKSSGSFRSAIGSIAISTSTAAPRPISQRSSAASRTARTSC